MWCSNNKAGDWALWTSNVNERICPIICNIEVESDEHVLTRCHTYMYFRDEIYNYAKAIDADFNNKKWLWQNVSYPCQSK